MGFADVDANARKVCEATIESLRHARVTVIEHDRIIVEHPLVSWWTLRTAGLACTLGDRIGTEDFARIDPPLQHMIQVGMKVTGRDYAQALDACHRFNYQLEQAFALAPVILGPTCVGRVPRSGKGGLVNGRETEDWVQRTFGLNLSRNPAATVYAECNEDGLPVGLQVIGRQRRDLDTLIAAGAIEQILGGPEQPG